MEFIVDAAFSFTTGWGKALPPHVINFMDESWIAYRGLFGQHTLRFTERRINPGDFIYVLGTAKKQLTA